MTDMIRKSFPIEIVKVNKYLGIVDAIVAVMGNIDHGDDIIHNGAFTKTITERGTKIKVLDNHNMNSNRDVIGKAMSLREMSKNELPESILNKYPDATGGLYTVSQFDMKDENAVTIFNKLADGFIDEWSIGFSIPKGKSDLENITKDGKSIVVRNIREVVLYEYSPVILGMNSATATVDAKNDDLDEIKKRSLIETYWLIADSFHKIYFDNDNNSGFITCDVFDNNSMLVRAVNVETEFLYYQLNYMTDGDNNYKFDSIENWLGGNYAFMVGIKEINLETLENKQGRVLSQRNYDKLTQAHELLMDVVNSATTQETPDEIETDNLEDLDETLAKSQEALTKQRDNDLLELKNILEYTHKTIGVH